MGELARVEIELCSDGSFVVGEQMEVYVHWLVTAIDQSNVQKMGPNRDLAGPDGETADGDRSSDGYEH